MKIEFRNIDDLIGYARNSRTHSPDQIDRLSSAIDEYGWTNPILSDGSSIVAGHGRIVAARKLYDAGKRIKLPSGQLIDDRSVPVIDCAGWSDAKRRAYVIWDNRSSELAGWDLELLKIELDDLRMEGFDVDLIGFSQDELDQMFPATAEDNGKDPDAIPDIPEIQHSVIGDMWVLGPHRLRCGDSTKIDDWNALMMGELADCQACDPPYNVNYESDIAGKIINDNMGNAQFRQFLYDFYTCSFAVMKPGAAMYVAHSDSEGLNFRGAFVDAGFKLSGCLTWKKKQHGHRAIGLPAHF